MAFIIYANNLKMQGCYSQYMLKTILKITFILLFSTGLLSSCSTKSPNKKVIKKAEQTIEPKHIENNQVSAQQRLAQSKTLPIQEAIPVLVEVSELYAKEQNYAKALWLANKTLPLISTSSTGDNLSNTNLTNTLANTLTNNQLLSFRLALVKIESLLAITLVNDQAEPKTENANIALSYQLLLQQQNSVKLNKTTAINQPYKKTYYQLLSKVATRKKLPIMSTDADLRAFALNQQASIEDVEILWKKMMSLSKWQLNQVSKKQAPFVKGWQKLLSYAHQFGDNRKQFSRYLSQWQREYPTHPARIIAEQLATAELKHIVINNIAVILPLTGNQKLAGNTALQGILAAYKNNQAKTLHFIDANTVDWSTLNTQLVNLNIDYVIGPLLKANVDAYLSQTNSQTNSQATAQTDVQTNVQVSTQLEPLLESKIPTLFLNLPSNGTLQPYQSALSMHPEDEANQAASTLGLDNYQNPLVISHQDKVSKRIAHAFAKQWLKTTGKNVDIVYFDKGKQMQNKVKTGLDVDSSQARIKEVKSRLKQTIKAESRNRRDIDMIYVVGSAQQTRLVKPYIDVNTSPFAQVIPVFASSRSHSISGDNSANRDLTGLTFTEIPWLLPSDLQNKPLAKLSRTLWPKRSDSLQKIFALGFDSYALIEKITLMQQAPYIRHFGQTGVLKLNESNILTRSLIWGRYQNSRVQHIAMD